jgi:predicted DNA binding protein
MIDREKLNKQIKIIAQDSWGIETNTTVNAMVEWIVVRAFEKLLDSLEPVIESQKVLDPDHISNELEDFRVKLRYLARDMEELKDASKNGRHENAKGNEKSYRNATKGNSTNADVTLNGGS